MEGIKRAHVLRTDQEEEKGLVSEHRLLLMVLISNHPLLEYVLC